MRRIQKDQGRLSRSICDPESLIDTTVDQHFVDEAGSAAIVGGRLYIDGKLATAGVHTVGLDKALKFTVDNKGRLRHEPRRPVGGGPR